MGNIAQRRKYILDKLKETGYVKVQELSEDLKVSEVTIRKELKRLEEKKILSRNYGNASIVMSIIPDRHIDIKGKKNKIISGMPEVKKNLYFCPV
jgi:DeoR family transcriptional regulator of aga operon